MLAVFFSKKKDLYSALQQTTQKSDSFLMKRANTAPKRILKQKHTAKCCLCCEIWGRTWMQFSQDRHLYQPACMMQHLGSFIEQARFQFSLTKTRNSCFEMQQLWHVVLTPNIAENQLEMFSLNVAQLNIFTNTPCFFFFFLDFQSQSYTW